ncbi:hypothetical protein Tco_1514314, partial [Tanacetum coccineum]
MSFLGQIPEPPRDPLLLTRTMRKSIIWHQIPTAVELELLYQIQRSCICILQRRGVGAGIVSSKIERLHEEYIRASMSKISASLDTSKVDSEGHKTQAIYRKARKARTSNNVEYGDLKSPPTRRRTSNNAVNKGIQLLLFSM